MNTKQEWKNSMKYTPIGKATLDDLDMSIFNDMRKARFGHIPVDEKEADLQMSIILLEWLSYSIDHEASLINNPVTEKSEYNNTH
jgi:hypothetical protein